MKEHGMSTSVEQIQAIVARWNELLVRRDHAAIAKLYETDGVLMPPGAPPVVGQRAIAEFWQVLASQPSFNAVLRPQRIDTPTSSDAVEFGTVALGNNGGADNAKYVVYWRKGADGWRIRFDIFNADG
jgi:uncharacterized protein (TIGR02246 family)